MSRKKGKVFPWWKGAAAVVLAGAGIAVCGILLYVFYQSELLDGTERYAVLVSDVGMILAILWLLRRYLRSLDSD